MKIKLTASAWSCISYKREKIIECDYDREEWDEMSERERDDYLDELRHEFVWNDIDCGAEVIEDENS